MKTNSYFTPSELRDLIVSIEEKRYDVRRKGQFVLGPMEEKAQQRNDQLTRLLAKLRAPCMY